MRIRRIVPIPLPLVLVLLAGCAAAPVAHERHAARESPPDDADLALRYVRPGQTVDPAWLAAARDQDRRLVHGLPHGEPVRPEPDASLAAAANTLDPSRFTSLGPRLLNDPAQYPLYVTTGRINALAVDPVDPAVAYLGSGGGGVWKTTNCCDANTVWTPLTDPPGGSTGSDPILDSAIGDLAIDPSDPQTIYAGTGDLRFSNWSFGSGGLLRSRDGGASWEVLGADVFGPFYAPSAGGQPQYQAIGKVVVHPTDSQRVAVGTKTGVFFSADAGASWSGPCYTNAYAGGPNAQRQDITALIAVPHPGDVDLYAAVGTRGAPTPTQPDLGANGANGVYRTVWPASGCPAGWTLLADGWPAGTGGGAPVAGIGRIELAVAPSDPARLYALVAHTALENGLYGIWRSLDGGDHWIETCSGNACVSGSSCDGFGQQMWYDAGLSVDPQNPGVVYASGQDLLRSTDGGLSFRNLTCGYANFDAVVHVDHHARAFVAGDSNRLLIGTDGGVYYSANASATVPDFIPLNASLDTLELYSGDIGADFATSAAPAISAGAQDNGSMAKVFTGAPGPAFWDGHAPGGDGTGTQIEPILGKRWYFSIAYGGIYVTYGSGGPGGGVAPIAPNWGGGSPNVERKSLLMPFQLYKYGALDVPGSGCTSTAGCTHLIAGTYRLWETVVGGLPGGEWYARTGDLTRNNLVLGNQNRSYINALAYATSDPSVAVVGTSDGKVQYVFGLGFQYGADCPASGTGAACAIAVDVTGGNAVLPDRPVLDVVTAPHDPLTAYAALGGFAGNSPGHPGHVFRVRCTAQCAGFVWDDRSGDLPDIPVNAIAVNPRFPPQAFAGTDWGLYYTDDITATVPHWQRFAGLPAIKVWDMAIDRGFTTLALFTRSRGAWAWPLPDPPDGIFRDGFDP